MKTRNIAVLSLTLLTTGLTAPAALAVDPSADVGPGGFVTHQALLTAETTSFSNGMGSTRCDVNGDGIDDALFGDPNWSRPGFDKVGAGYVLLGSETTGGGDLSDPSAGNAVRIDGGPKEVSGGTWVGAAIDCAGDVNGDGIDDVVVGTNSRMHHEVAVVFGARDFGPVDVSELGDRGYLVVDPEADDKTLADKQTDNFGASVGPAGDVDGDGLADLAISDLLADHNGTNSGRVWIVRGKATTATVDVRRDVDQVLMTLDGARASDRLDGATTAGDVNGDGRDDLLVGAHAAAPWANGTTANGAAHVVFGGQTGHLVVGAPRTQGFDIHGPARGKDRIGISVAALGDVNGDGLADVIIGGDSSVNTLPGGAAVVLGSASQNTVVIDPDGAKSVYECQDGALDDCATSTKVARGHYIEGAALHSKAGFAVAGSPDLNGDGAPDALIGAYNEGTNGAAYVVHLDGDRTETLELAGLDAAQGTRLQVAVSGSTRYGRTIASVGDIDDNGTADVAFGGVNGGATVLLAGSLKSKTALEVEEGAVAGYASALEISVAPSARAVANDLSGTAAVSIDGKAVEGLEAVTLTNGSASVELPALDAGTHAVEVAYTPTAGRGVRPSAGGAILEVAHRVATGRLSLDSRSVSAGDEVEALVTTKQPISGTVDVLVDGRVVGTTAVVDGEGVVTLRGLAVGRHEVQAVYGGDALHAGFETATTTLRVSKVDAELGAVSVSRSSLVHGTGDVTVKVAVPGGNGGAVNFYDNGSLLGRATVGADGVASVVVKTPRAGVHDITARFLGNATLRATGPGDEVRFTVARASLKTLKVTGKKFRKGSRPKVTVTLGRLTNGRYPSGTVRVSSGGRTYRAKVTTGAKGKVALTLKRATKAVKVRATFTPTDVRNVAGATSASVKVRVRS